MYKIIRVTSENSIGSVFHVESKTSIPMSDDNTDYQAYLKWLEEGNVPTPADELASE